MPTAPAGDKEIWFFDHPSNAIPGSVSNDVEFKWIDVNANNLFDPAIDHHHVDVDFNPDLLNPSNISDLVSIFNYAIKITLPGYSFKDVALGTSLSPGNYNTKKEVFAATLDTSGSPVCGSRIALLTNPPNPDGWDPIGGNVICVRDTLTIPAGSTAVVDTYQNAFRQGVPAPLPILGLAAAFRSVRRMRKLSSKLKVVYGA